MAKVQEQAKQLLSDALAALDVLTVAQVLAQTYGREDREAIIDTLSEPVE